METKNLACFLSIALIGSGLFTAQVAGKPLERTSFYRFKAFVTTKDGARQLRIRGMFKDKFVGIGATKTTFSGSQMKVLNMPSHDKAQQTFDFSIPLPSAVTKVLYGSAEAEIWPDDQLKDVRSSDERNALATAIKRFLDEHPDLSLDDYNFDVERINVSRDSIRITVCGYGEPTKLFHYDISF